jgi:cell division protein FtsI/penicillin-binding protein 2
VALALISFLPVLTAAQSRDPQIALHRALGQTSAVAVLLDGKSGHLLAVERAREAGEIASSPGSTLKPIFLIEALRAGVIDANSTILCRRNLRIAGRNLACTHPLDENAFDAEKALAYSCNSYFANLARHFSPEQEVNVLRNYGFGSRTGLFSPESPGSVIRPESEDSLQLAVLGLETMSVTPAQLARAYFLLAQRIHETLAVQRGLEDSVAYGMAHNAFTSGLAIAGKTGTASDPGQSWTHGWFAGIVSRGQRSMIVVIYVPRGNGAYAAQLAHRFFVEWQRAVAR